MSSGIYSLKYTRSRFIYLKYREINEINEGLNERNLPSTGHFPKVARLIPETRNPLGLPLG